MSMIRKIPMVAALLSMFGGPERPTIHTADVPPSLPFDDGLSSSRARASVPFRARSAWPFGLEFRDDPDALARANTLRSDRSREALAILKRRRVAKTRAAQNKNQRAANDRALERSRAVFL